MLNYSKEIDMVHNKEDQVFSFKKRLKSFTYAIQGIKTLIKEEHNARIHITAMLIVLFLGFYFDIDSQEWCAIILCFGSVLSMEAINSGIENLADFSTQDKNEFIKKCKDLSAAAVLITAITSLIIGCIIFIPKIQTTYFNNN